MIGWNKSTWNVRIKDDFDIWVACKSIRGTELYNWVNDPVFGLRILQVKIKAFIHNFVQFLKFFLIATVETGSNLT